MKINLKNISITLVSSMLFILFSACGGGSSDGKRGVDSHAIFQSTPILEGIFIDANVKGLRYETATQKGYTDTKGSFKYQAGESIEFFVGNLSLGSAKATEIMTPYTLTDDNDLDNPKDTTLNIALLLQNFDSNRSNQGTIDVQKLQNYKFSTLNLNSSSFESEITTLLSTASFQKYIDSNNTLISKDKVKEHLNSNVKKHLCMLKIISDDTNYVDKFPADIQWDGASDTVKDIERAFNKARAKDPTISHTLIMPSQAKWDSMTYEERGLYLLNNERYYRGIKPFEGISSRVSTVSQGYAQYLYDHGVFGHNEDGTPWERLDRDKIIKNNRDFFKYAENLYTHGSSGHYLNNPVAKAIYGFIYDDNASTGGSYGHRRFCLATGLKDNSAESGKEGLIGFGVKQGRKYGLYKDGYYSTIVVMNAFDPSSTWDHSTTHSIPFCTPTQSSK